MQKKPRKVGECEICGAGANLWRCPDHNKCDDCGTTENICNRRDGLFCDACHEKRVEKRISENATTTTFDTTEITCPWCGYEYRDSWEKTVGEMECSDCGMAFEAERECIVTYNTSRM